MIHGNMTLDQAEAVADEVLRDCPEAVVSIVRRPSGDYAVAFPADWDPLKGYVVAKYGPILFDRGRRFAEENAVRRAEMDRQYADEADIETSEVVR